MSNVQEVFGQYAVEINGKVELFATESEAATAEAQALNGEAFAARANAYVQARGLEGSKLIKTKTNVITDFLAFEASLPSVAPSFVGGLEEVA